MKKKQRKKRLCISGWSTECDAEALGLPVEGQRLAELVSFEEFPRLVGGLVRTQLAHDADDLRQQAA